MKRKNYDEVKKEAKSFIERIFEKFTPNMARWFSVIVTIIVLCLFLCTNVGRSVLSFIAYVVFAVAALYFGVKLYKYSTSKAKGVPKQRKVINDIEPEPVDTEPEVSDDSIEWKPEKVTEESDVSDNAEAVESTDSEEPKAVQISMDDLPVEDSK